MNHQTFQSTPAGENILPAVHNAVAEQEGIEPTELDPPLYDVVDTEALRDLFAPTAGGSQRSGGQAIFPYHGCTVVIDFGIHDDNTWVRVIEQPT